MNSLKMLRKPLKAFGIICIIICVKANANPYNHYQLNCDLQNDSMNVVCDYSIGNVYSESDYFLLSNIIPIKWITNDNNPIHFTRFGDTVRLHQPTNGETLHIAYTIPITYFKTNDGALCLRRENHWYPYRENELLTASVSIGAPSYYIICGNESASQHTVNLAYEIHLIMLPKDIYQLEIDRTHSRPFYFYHDIKNSKRDTCSFFLTFMEAYDFYAIFFQDSLSTCPMNIVEIIDSTFTLCQSLQDMILFNDYFLAIYEMMPDYSWVPHEVAHQWWGNRLFFEYRDYAISESVTEYLKLQYLKHNKKGYEDQIELYQGTIEYATTPLPIKDIHDVSTQDASIAIYHKGPYRLEQSNLSCPQCELDKYLQELFASHKNSILPRNDFLNMTANPSLKSALDKWISEL